MTDEARLLEFLAGAGLPHDVTERRDVDVLPAGGSEEILFVRYSTVVSGWGNDDYLFAEDGHLVGVRRKNWPKDGAG